MLDCSSIKGLSCSLTMVCRVFRFLYSIVQCLSTTAGWTPLHYAALLSPPTLVSFLMTHGCSVFALTNRNLTPLHIVTAHSTLPGREDIALLLEESMRSQGWEGGRMDQRRRIVERQQKHRRKQMQLRQDVATLLGVHHSWWGQKPEFPDAEDNDVDDDDGGGDNDDPDDYEIYVSQASSMIIAMTI